MDDKIMPVDIMLLLLLLIHCLLALLFFFLRLQEFHTIDASYYHYRMIVTSGAVLDPNASFCVEDIVFYDGNNTPIDTNGQECSTAEVRRPFVRS